GASPSIRRRTAAGPSTVSLPLALPPPATALVSASVPPSPSVAVPARRPGPWLSAAARRPSIVRSLHQWLLSLATSLGLHPLYPEAPAECAPPFPAKAEYPLHVPGKDHLFGVCQLPTQNPGRAGAPATETANNHWTPQRAHSLQVFASPEVQSTPG